MVDKPGASAHFRAPRGPMAEWLRRGLQIPARRFDSGSGLQTKSRPSVSAQNASRNSGNWSYLAFPHERLRLLTRKIRSNSLTATCPPSSAEMRSPIISACLAIDPDVA